MSEADDVLVLSGAPQAPLAPANDGGGALPREPPLHQNILWQMVHDAPDDAPSYAALMRALKCGDVPLPVKELFDAAWQMRGTRVFRAAWRNGVFFGDSETEEHVLCTVLSSKPTVYTTRALALSLSRRADLMARCQPTVWKWMAMPLEAEVMENLLQLAANFAIIGGELEKDRS